MNNISSEVYEFQLYLEGVRVDFISIQISATGNGISASIDMPPEVELLDIKERTLAQVFFRKHGDKSFRMLFDGEVIGYNSAKTHAMNTVSLQCRDISSYLETMFIYFCGLADPMNTNPKVIQHFGAPTSGISGIEDNINRDVVSEIIGAQKQTTEVSMIGIIRALIQRVASVNPFYSSILNNHKYLSRFYNLSDAQSSEIFTLELMKSLSTTLQHNGLDNVKQISDSYLGLVFYEMSYISSPFYKDGGSLRQIIYKPDNFSIAPPSCNILFPNMLSGYSFGRSFMQEPTRVAIRGTDSLLYDPYNYAVMDQFSYIAYSPSSLSGVKDDIKKSGPDGKDGALHSKLINNEYYKGIIPYYMQNFPAANIMQGMDYKATAEGGEPCSALKVINCAADYYYEKLQCANRRLQTLECVFNPNLVVGFPGIVMVDPYIFFGVIRQVNHMITSSGNISSSIQMDHVRSVPAVSNTKLSSNELKNSYPTWLNNSYKTGSINSAYQSLFGCNSILAELGGSKMAENARSAYTKYKASEDRGFGNKFSNDYTSRPIITKEQFYEKFLKIGTEQNEKYPTGSYFIPVRQNVILNYKNKYRKPS